MPFDQHETTYEKNVRILADRAYEIHLMTGCSLEDAMRQTKAEFDGGLHVAPVRMEVR